MITTTGNACASGISPPTTPDRPDLDKFRELTEQKTCTSAQFSEKLNLAEITTIAKTNTYIQGMKEVTDFQRVGFESQCNGIAIVKNTRTIKPTLCPDKLYWYYPDSVKTQAYFDELPYEDLLKGQILARTEQTAAGAPLIALTVDLLRFSHLEHIYYPELITAPLTRQEFAQLNIQTSLDHFRRVFISHLTQPKAYPLSEVIATCNSTRPPDAMALIIEDQVPQNPFSHHPVGRPIDYSFYSDPLAATFWWTQANIAIPFKNIKKLHQVMNQEGKLEVTIESILNDSVFNKYFVEPLQKNQLTDAWLWHFLYLAMSFGSRLGPANTKYSWTELPKSRLLNLRYSHHQLIMEIMDDEGINILSEKILHDIFKRVLFINIIRKAVNHYHTQNYQEDAEQNPKFHHWLQDYLDDLINLCELRKKHGKSTVFNTINNKPFILVNDSPYYLSFELLNSFRYLRTGYYRFVLPTYTNDNDEPCTVLERRYIPKTSWSVTQGEHYLFTSQSNWYSKPTEEEQKHLDLYWA